MERFRSAVSGLAQIDFGSVKMIDEVDVFTLQDNSGNWSTADGYSTYFHGIANYHCGYNIPNTYKNLPKKRK